MKILFLHLFKWLGGFLFTRYLIRKKTLILTYHSFEVVDETRFRPKLFIKQSTFEQRLKYLKKYCNVIKLDDLSKSNKPNNSIVLTIDDGWASTSTIAAPLLNHFDLPYSIYLTTEGVLSQQPLFHILLDYILRSSLGKTLHLISEQHEPLKKNIKLENIAELSREIEKFKLEKYDTKLLRTIAKNLEFSIDELIDKRIFTLLSVSEVKTLSMLGADIQLHTHSHHNYVDDETEFSAEIKVNQSLIEKMTGVKPIHHCYPSGVFNQPCFNYLRSLGIETATTCIPGFCDDKSHKFKLPRFLDGENIPKIVFEAEVSGALELLRKLRKSCFPDNFL